MKVLRIDDDPSLDQSFKDEFKDCKIIFMIELEHSHIEKMNLKFNKISYYLDFTFLGFRNESDAIIAKLVLSNL